MKSLTINKTDYRYPIVKFSKLRQLGHITKCNYAALTSVCERINHNLVNQHVLVQLLNKLGISKTWDLEYLISIVKSERNGITSFYDFTTVNNRGRGQNNVYYGGDYYEHLVILDLKHDCEYYAKKDYKLLTPIVPLYTTSTDYGFIGMYEKPLKGGGREYKGYGLLGVDIVELAVGYWRWLNSGIGYEWDAQCCPHNYIPKYPMVNCTMIQNQLARVNILYNNRVKGKTLEDFDVLSGSFTHIPSRDIYLESIKNIDKQASSKKLINAENLLALFDPLGDYLNLNYGIYQYFDQTKWCLQLNVIKLLTLTLTYNNLKFVKTGQVSTIVVRWLSDYKDMLLNVKDPRFKEHIKELIGELKLANDLSLK